MKRILILISLLIAGSVMAQSVFGPIQKVKRPKKKVVGAAPEANFKYPQWDNPLMSESNAPSGKAIASTVYAAGYEAWRAFDRGFGTTTQRWIAGNAVAYPHWVEFDSGSGASNLAVTFLLNNYDNSEYSYNLFSVQGSQDESAWVNCITGNFAMVDEKFQVWEIASPAYYRYYRINGTNGYTAPWANIHFCKFSSAKLIVPRMTAANTPAPYVVTASTNYAATNHGWEAFDGYAGLTHRWLATNKTASAWVKIDMGSNVLVNGFGILTADGYGYNNIKITASLNDSDYVTIIETNLNDTWAGDVTYTSPEYQHIVTQNKTAYRYWNFGTTNAYNAGVFDLIQTREILLWQYELE